MAKQILFCYDDVFEILDTQRASPPSGTFNNKK